MQEDMSRVSLADDRANLKSFSRFLENSSLKVYKENFDEVKDTLSELGGQISLSVDLLRHETRRDVKEYLCLSAHFVDDDWKLQKWVIKYCEVYGGGDMLHPTTVALQSLKEWDIEGKIFAVTLGDGHQPLDTAEAVLEEVQKRRELPLNGKLFHVPCCSDFISQMVQGGFNMISDIIDKVQCLAWSNSMPLWYLTTTKLQNALQLEDMGEFSSREAGYDMPSAEEWGKLRSVCKMMDQIYKITEGLFKCKNPTANMFLPHLQEILACLKQEAAGSDQFAKTVAEKMLKMFNKYWEDTYLSLAIASFLDPRYKLKLIGFSASKLGDGDEKAAHVLENIRKVYDSYALQNDQNEYLLSDSSSEPDEEEDDELEDDEEAGEEEAEEHVARQRPNLVDKLTVLKEFCCAMESVKDQPHKSALDLYLEEPVLPWTANFSVLQWWKVYSSKYPQLSRMARDFLAVPMSVATSDGAYYIEPRGADKSVVSMKPEMMNALMCTRSWKLGLTDLS